MLLRRDGTGTGVPGASILDPRGKSPSPVRYPANRPGNVCYRPRTLSRVGYDGLAMCPGWVPPPRELLSLYRGATCLLVVTWADLELLSLFPLHSPAGHADYIQHDAAVSRQLDTDEAGRRVYPHLAR